MIIDEVSCLLTISSTILSLIPLYEIIKKWIEKRNEAIIILNRVDGSELRLTNVNDVDSIIKSFSKGKEYEQIRIEK